MAGSTSEEQSVWDVPMSGKSQDPNASSDRQSPGSSNSPESLTQVQNEQQQIDETVATNPSQNTKQKRIACIICRKRKLKCDGARSTCSTCARLKHNCGYDETRKKSGPKRGYVKELEKRLKQIETQLETGPGTERSRSSEREAFGLDAHDTGPSLAARFWKSGTSPSADPKSKASHSIDPESTGSFPWEMMSLGLEEPLPDQDMITELHRIYFDKLHPNMPMIHKYRYLAAMNLAPNMRPPITLRYAIWAYACSATEKFQNFREIFYQRARKYAEFDEMKGFGEQTFTIGHVQAWVLIANYEFKLLYFPRAWMSAGRAARLAQMLGLYRLDGSVLEVKECLGGAKDWVEREERRRTFWAAYCFDRWGSIGTGWPMSIDERDIHTYLPSLDESFEKGREEKGLTLAAVLTGADPAKLSSYAGIILMASIIGKTLTHLHRTESRDDAHDTENGEFWKRHRYLDHMLTNTAICLPEHLRIGPGIRDPNVVFLHLNMHSTAICLHQAAIVKAEQNELDISIIKLSTDRCYLAATEIANIWRTISHMDIGYLNPYVAFCLYVGARVFVHDFKKNPHDEDSRCSLHFLLNAMEAHSRRNDITESFLMSLLVDLDEAGFDSVLLRRHKTFTANRGAYAIYNEAQGCPSILQKHSDTQPSFRDMRNQANRQQPVRIYNDPTLDTDTTGLDIPIRTALSNAPMSMLGQHIGSSHLHNVSLSPEYDLSAQFGTGQASGSNTEHDILHDQPAFSQSIRPSPDQGQSQLQHHQQQHSQGSNEGQFFNQGELDLNMLNNDGNGTNQDISMVQCFQNTDWNSIRVNYPDGRQSSSAAAWADFL